MPRKGRNPKREKKPFQEKTGVSGARFRKDPIFKNSRRAMGEFGLASRSATLIRREFANMLEHTPQRDTHMQLTKKIAVLVREQKAAGTQRIRLNNLDWEKLRNFEFNKEVSLSALLHVDFKIALDADSGQITLALSNITVLRAVSELKEISHVRIIAAAASIDFSTEITVSDRTATDYILKDQPFEKEINLRLQLKPPLLHPVFIVLGFICFGEVNKIKYELYNQRFRALSIITIGNAQLPATSVRRIKK